MLKGDMDERSLPIFIGAAEAQAIALHINKVEIPRPLTHDLLKNVLDSQECRLKRVEVCGLKEGTFFATLILERDGEEMAMDSRPSDGIALALRCGAPLFVAEEVMEEAGQVFTGAEGQIEKPGESGPEAEIKSNDLTPLDLLKEELQKAIDAERYEDAARLRDEIKRLEDPHASN